mmetsp:Transcript_20949/g.32355  ORF Transcript_20949/g.32355 Transcript_20949/m.32355 type:complete len:282 (-) Transcript_20949:1735-2580(-)
MAVPPPASEKMLLVLMRSIKVTEVTLKLTCHPLRTLSNVTLMLSCAAGPRIVKPPTTTETVTEILTVKIVLTRIPPITQTCALLTWKRAPLLVDSTQTDLLNSLETVTMEREPSIAMDMHGLMTSMIPSLATGPTISSTFQCMITCINAVMLRIFLVLPCVDASSKCPPSLALTVPRLTPPRGSRSLTIALPMRLKEASPSLTLTSMRAKVSITVTTISGLTWAVSSTKARSRTLSGVRLVASSPTATARQPFVPNMMKWVSGMVMITTCPLSHLLRVGES